MSERKTCGSVAQHRVLAWEAAVLYHGRTTTRHCISNWKVSAAFVITLANGETFFFLRFLSFFKNYNPLGR